MGSGHQDKIAVITGAAAGIGQAFAQRLAQDGAHVVVADIAPAPDTIKLVEAAGRQALFCQCDVAAPDSVAALAAAVERNFGRCDILINNAGIYPVQQFEEIGFADWRRVLSINLDAAFLTAAAFVPGMKKRRWGRIVNMSSSTFNTVVSGYAHYIASKGGIVGLTRALASELGDHGITVNAIAPAITHTPGTRGREDRFAAVVKAQAIKRAEIPADLVGAMAFLTGDDAAFITGQVLYVDGGMVRV